MATKLWQDVYGREVPSILPDPGSSQDITAPVGSASATLSAGTRHIRIVAVDGDIRYRLGTGSATAGATDTYLPQGVVEIIAVFEHDTFAATRVGASNVVVNITEAGGE